MDAHDIYRMIRVRRELHGKIKALAVLNEVKMSDLASAMLEYVLKDEETVKKIIAKLHLYKRK